MFLGNLRTLQIARKCFSGKYSKTKFSIKPNIFLPGSKFGLMSSWGMSTCKHNTFDHVGLGLTGSWHYNPLAELPER